MKDEDPWEKFYREEDELIESFGSLEKYYEIDRDLDRELKLNEKTIFSEYDYVDSVDKELIIDLTSGEYIGGEVDRETIIDFFSENNSYGKEIYLQVGNSNTYIEEGELISALAEIKNDKPALFTFKTGIDKLVLVLISNEFLKGINDVNAFDDTIKGFFSKDLNIKIGYYSCDQVKDICVTILSSGDKQIPPPINISDSSTIGDDDLNFKSKVIATAKKRLRSKAYFSEGILYSGVFFDWLFTVHNVGKNVQKQYSAWLKTLANNVYFRTSKGRIITNDIKALVIPQATREAYIVINDKEEPIYHDEFPLKRIYAGNIAEIKIQSAESVNEKIKRLIGSFKALPDLMNVLKHISDKEMNTSTRCQRDLLAKLNSLSEDDDDIRLIKCMANDLLYDMKLIFSDLVLYWG